MKTNENDYNISESQQRWQKRGDILRCDNCGKILKETYFISLNENFCEDCGSKFLTYNEQIGYYVRNEDNRLFYLDDEMSDLEIFKLFKEGD